MLLVRSYCVDISAPPPQDRMALRLFFFFKSRSRFNVFLFLIFWEGAKVRSKVPGFLRLVAVAHRFTMQVLCLLRSTCGSSIHMVFPSKDFNQPTARLALCCNSRSNNPTDCPLSLQQQLWVFMLACFLLFYMIKTVIFTAF